MKGHKGFINSLKVITFLLIFASASSVSAVVTVSVLNPKPGTSTSPSVVSLMPTSNDFKVQVQVWNSAGLAITAVNLRYNATSAPASCSAATGTVALSLNSNYSCGTNCGIYEANVTALTAGTNYYLCASATDGTTTGYSSDQRTGNDARYVYISVKAAKTGTGMLLARDSSSQICLDCHNTKSHSSQATDTSYGNWQTVCYECHTPHKTTNIYLVNTTITTPNSGNKSVVLWNTSGDGANSYVNASAGAATAGICQVCHTQTTGNGTARWRNTGNLESPAHYGAPGTQRCTSCHNHTGGFKGGGCNGCHSYDTIAGSWGSNPQAIEGYGAHAKHIDHIKTRFTVTLDANADTFGAGAAAKVCGTCHTNASVAHSTGGGGTRTINFGDGRYREGSTTGADGFNYVFGLSNPVYSGVVGNPSSVNPKSCSVVGCHFTTSPVWQAY